MKMGWNGRVKWGGEVQGVEGRSKGAVVEGSALPGQQPASKQELSDSQMAGGRGFVTESGASLAIASRHHSPTSAFFSINGHFKSRQLPH